MITPTLLQIFVGNLMIEHSSQSGSMELRQNGSKVTLNHKQNNGLPKNGLKVMQNIHQLCTREQLDQSSHLVLN
jgi:hypothetical protein